MLSNVMNILKLVLSGGANFLALLPQLFAIYNNVKKIVGDAQTQSFLADLDESTSMVIKSDDPNLSVEEKRKLRRDALEKSRNIWSRVSG